MPDGRAGWIKLTDDDAERLGGLAGELEHLPPEIKRIFDQDGRDARYLRILQAKVLEAIRNPKDEVKEQMLETLDACLGLLSDEERSGSIILTPEQNDREIELMVKCEAAIRAYHKERGVE